MKLGERALTIGASMGGLLAARVLADHYAQVWLLERDTLPAPGENRKGVPQGQHAHALLAAGREALERFFPGLTAEIVRQGGMTTDIARLRWFDHGGYHARCTGIEALLISRPTLESQLRRRLLALPNVRILERASALSLVVRRAGGPVVGVRVARQAEALTAEETVEADLVVDSSGRGSKASAWLAALGFTPPPEDVVQVALGYSTRLYRRRPDQLSGDAAAVIVPTPPHRRGAVLLPIEGERWMVTLIGLLGDHPPIDEHGFLDFSGSLAAPDIYDVLRNAEPLTVPVAFRFPASARRCYERMKRFPQGYLVFGDAICSFNPVYGQGISVAALQAIELGKALAQGGDGLAGRFFQNAARVVDTPWMIAVGGDLSYPDVDGVRTTMTRFINWYLGKLHVAARRDPHLTLAFQKVANLLAPPPSLLRPDVALRVLRGHLGGRLTAAPPAARTALRRGA
jgi:2-polyprenyl-6-methoxyphenol hydroxylase-like FAD-dependent oxidoreductase